MIPSAKPTRVTSHAVDRFIERHHPTYSRAHASHELRRAIKFVVFVEDEPKNGQSLWRTMCGVLLVVGRDGEVRTCLPVGATKPRLRGRR